MMADAMLTPYWPQHKSESDFIESESGFIESESRFIESESGFIESESDFIESESGFIESEAGFVEFEWISKRKNHVCLPTRGDFLSEVICTINAKVCDIKKKSRRLLAGFSVTGASGLSDVNSGRGGRSTNRKSANLRTYTFLDLRTFRKCSNLRFVYYIFCDLRICDLRTQLFLRT